MTNKFELKRWLEGTRANWGLIAQCAIWVLSVVGTFVLSPPDTSTDDNKIYLALAKFVVAVLIGLTVILASRWYHRKHSLSWALAALIFLVLAVYSFDTYQRWVNSWTCEYDNHKRITGSVFTQQGQNYVVMNPGINCKNLLLDFVGNNEDIWTKASIDERRLSLTRIYLLCIVLFTLCLLFIIQAVYCATINEARQTNSS